MTYTQVMKRTLLRVAFQIFPEGHRGIKPSRKFGLMGMCILAFGLASLSAHGQTFVQVGAGAVPRTMQAKMSDIVNVRDFGAQCNGQNDDTAAFQAAHDSATYGLTINIPPGICMVNANINVSKPNIKWHGSGQGTTAIVMGAAVTKLFNVTNNTSTQLFGPEFSDFLVDGHLSPAGSAFYFNSVRSATIERIYTVVCYRSFFFDSTTYGPINTVHMNSFYIENTPDLAGARGILINGAGDDWFISNGRLTENSQCQNNIGMEVTSAGGLYFTNIDISLWGRALVIDPPSGAFVRFGQLTGLNADSSWGDNVTLDGTAGYASGYPNGLYNINFVNSWFSSAGVNGGNGNGINVVYAQGVVIDTSQIYSNSLNGVRIQQPSHNITVSHNQISANSNGNGNQGRNNGVYSGIEVDANTDSFGLDNNKSGIIGYTPNSQKYGISIAAGCINYRVIGNDLNNNLTGPYNDLSRAPSSQVGLNIPSTVQPN